MNNASVWIHFLLFYVFPIQTYLFNRLFQRQSVVKVNRFHLSSNFYLSSRKKQKNSEVDRLDYQYNLLSSLAGEFDDEFQIKSYNIGKSHSQNNTNLFDFGLSVVLASYSFESYNEPVVGKIAKGIDGTSVVFTSTEYIRRIFSGTVFVTIDRGQFKYDESQPLDRVISGNNPDPYIVITAIEDGALAPSSNYNSNQSQNCNKLVYGRIIDSMRSSTKKDKKMAEWKENYFLYISNPNTSRIMFQAYDENIHASGISVSSTKTAADSDSLIGQGMINVKDLMEMSNADARSYGGPITLPVPLYAFNYTKGWLVVNRERPARAGTVIVKLEYIPWAEQTEPLPVTVNNNSQINNTDNSGVDAIEESSNASNSNSFLTSNKDYIKHLPSGASPNILNWINLLQNILSTQEGSHEILESLALGSLKQICSIDNAETDTQAGIWADFTLRRIVVSFRGTEAVKFKDILTDLNIFQSSYMEGESELDKVKIHQGFLTAFFSVREALLQQLYFIMLLTNEKENVNSKSWEIYICGHSLGGALATLLTFDLSRIRAGLVSSKGFKSDEVNDEINKNYKKNQNQSLSLIENPFIQPRAENILHFFKQLMFSSQSSAIENNDNVNDNATAKKPLNDFYQDALLEPAVPIDPALSYTQDVVFMSVLNQSKITCYSYGAPRVGNSHFKTLFNRLVPYGCYRVVNKLDVVARLPRTSKAYMFFDYDHVGKTVLIDDQDTLSAAPNIDDTITSKNDSTSAGVVSLWVEGESQGVCPVNDVALFSEEFSLDTSVAVDWLYSTLNNTNQNWASFTNTVSTEQLTRLFSDTILNPLSGVVNNTKNTILSSILTASLQSYSLELPSLDNTIMSKLTPTDILQYYYKYNYNADNNDYNSNNNANISNSNIVVDPNYNLLSDINRHVDGIVQTYLTQYSRMFLQQKRDLLATNNSYNNSNHPDKDDIKIIMKNNSFGSLAWSSSAYTSLQNQLISSLNQSITLLQNYSSLPAWPLTLPMTSPLSLPLSMTLSLSSNNITDYLEAIKSNTIQKYSFEVSKWNTNNNIISSSKQQNASYDSQQLQQPGITMDAWDGINDRTPSNNNNINIILENKMENKNEFNRENNIIFPFELKLPPVIDSKFVEREIRMLRGLLDGTALNHHFEESYYIALERVFNQSQLYHKITGLDENEMT
eukprot:gene4829-6767_t